LSPFAQLTNLNGPVPTGFVLSFAADCGPTMTEAGQPSQ
jgi:hypothetical protein